MGLFDSKWIVDFEYSDGFLSSYKKASMVVEASSEYSAKDKAKSILKTSYKYVKVLSAHKSSGKDEERKANFTPNITIIEKPSSPSTDYQKEETRTRHLTPQERELLLEQIRQREKIKKQKEKLCEVEMKAKAVKKAAKYHIRTSILSGILSLIAFLLGWIPYWISSFKALASKSQLDMWIELGHSESDVTGSELVSDISKYTKEANSIIWVPFVVLAIGILITIIVFIVCKSKTQSKIDKASEELKIVVKDYEIEYGEIGSLDQNR